MNQELEITIEALERTANFEGNQTELMLQRLSSAKVFDQIVDAWEARLQVDWKHGDSRGMQEMEGESTLQKNMRMFYLPKNRQEIEVELQRRIDEALLFTPVRFERDTNADTESIPTEFVLPDGNRANTLQMSIAEAHEKGHLIRTYQGMYYEMTFHSGFHFSTEALEADVERRNKKKLSPAKRNIEISETYRYISEPMELCERMAQVKNYFGMKGGEVFTKAHLDYAREHYVVDTGMDNNMTLFFECITPETEEDFLKLMNTIGI